MSKKANSIRIGVFVILSFFLLIAGIILFGGGNLFARRNMAIVFFDGSLQGLNLGAPVAYRGITIGEIVSINIDVNPTTYQIKVPVLISLNPDRIINLTTENDTAPDVNSFLTAMRDRGLRATLKTQSLLTGKLYIDLAVHPNSEAIYHDKEGKYLEIPTIPSELQQITQAVQSLDFLELAAQFSNTMAALEKMSTRLEQAIGSEDSQKNLDLLFDSLARFHSIITKFDDNVLPIMGKVNFTLDSVTRLSQDSNQLVIHLDEDITPLLASLNSTANETGLAMRAAGAFMDSLRQSTAPTSPFFFQLSEGVNEFARAAKSIRIFTDHLDRNPQRLIFGLEPQGEPSK